MAVNINVPSQVKTYANLAAFPATGALKTIYIAEDTNKTYRWTGSVYTEISASAAMTWGAIGGTLSNQTDLQNALNAKQDDITLTTTGSSGASTLVGATLNVPNYTLSGLGGVSTSRTLTINGVTQDLSADRTFTISTGITIGSTAIASGTVGRILFEGTGNVVQESGNLFWDNTNGRLGIGGTPSTFNLDVNGTARVQSLLSVIGSAGISLYGTNNLELYTESIGATIRTTNSNMRFGTNNATRMMLSGGNVLINTTTDAGFRLDVNGTARVSGAATLAGTNTLSGTTNVSGLSSNWICQYPSNATVKPLSFSAQSGGATSNNVAIQFGFNFRESGGLFTQDIFQNILYDNTTNNVVTGFEWYTHQTQAGSNPSVLAMALRGKTLSIGTNTPNASAVLQADSTTQGFLPPRMTTTQKNAIATPAAGLMVYDTTLNVISYYNGTMWI